MSLPAGPPAKLPLPTPGAPPRKWWTTSLTGEWLFVAFGAACLLYVGYWYVKLEYLIPPFFPDPNDIWADGFSTAYWAFRKHAYDTWATVYPPLTFVVLRLIGNPRCYVGDVAFGRDCDWQTWWVLGFFFVLNGRLAYTALRANDPRTALPRTLALMGSLPMLYAWEHLNILIMAYTGLFIAFNGSIRSARVKQFAFAMTLNFKPYFLVVWGSQVLRKRWRWAEATGVMAAGIYGVTWAIVGEGSPSVLINNIFVFSDAPARAANWWFVVFASSYTSMIQFLNNQIQPLIPWLGSWRIEFWSWVLDYLIFLMKLVSFSGFAAVWMKPGAVSRTRVAAMCYCFLHITTEPNGYTMAGMIFLVFFEKWEGPLLTIALLCAYMLTLSFDVETRFINSRYWVGYLAKHNVYQELWVTVGPLVRPFLIMIIQTCLVAATWIDFRKAWLRDGTLSERRPFARRPAVA